MLCTKACVKKIAFLPESGWVLKIGCSTVFAAETSAPTSSKMLLFEWTARRSSNSDLITASSSS